MTNRTLAEARRWVIKIGSSLVTNQGLGLDHARIAKWVTQIEALVTQGHEVVLVSSGAVAEGCARLQLASRPTELSALQATAAVGQMGLIHAYETAFRVHDRQTAQVLLTHDDVKDRGRYLNARQALLRLLAWQVLPVVNENDTVATDEIRLGDNDTLAAMVCNLIDADVLLILTDQPGLCSDDPRRVPEARLIERIGVNDSRLDEMAGDGRGDLGRGGMKTKVQAARWAARSGACTVIASGHEPELIGRAAAGELRGTLLLPETDALAARKRWLAGPQKPTGVLRIDAGAASALRRGGTSLLPVGVTAVDGSFRRGDVVSCVGPDGHELARGISNYGSDQAEQLLGLGSAAVAERLGDAAVQPELIHCDNLVLLEPVAG